MAGDRLDGLSEANTKIGRETNISNTGLGQQNTGCISILMKVPQNGGRYLKTTVRSVELLSSLTTVPRQSLLDETSALLAGNQNPSAQ